MRLILRENVHALTGVYALDAIDGSERERFEHHLSRCPACDNEVRGLQETATRFALAVSAQPPDRLKERVMTAAAQTRQVPPVPHLHARPPEPGTVWVRRLAMPLAAACLVIAVVLGVLLGMARSQLDTARTQQRQVAAVLNAPGARLVSVRTSVGGLATVVVASRLHELIFTSNGMPGLPSSKVYQLWVMGANGSATSAGLLARTANGSTSPVLASGLVRGDRVGVTVEPAGGTTKPTTTPIVVISLPS
jgi:anti-sigma-K factor RskA